ncbi:TonB-dependent receptor [Sphingomonas sp. CGMCC 1.13654]|uniref:TonB-dependent receptor n=1 Tax=Sphingomonas chungangi TaxID=2683589 RepID=A0A838L4T6_9SPHN|nr:TonB-dependent receptor [Sphingomonas chungangi]MBA2933705.1 TonB-dependent receptor [Sphingomonas chungangi]MVW55037.1 TonB-dependent receptor [Sphingomonas chungangi]
MPLEPIIRKALLGTVALAVLAPAAAFAQASGAPVAAPASPPPTPGSPAPSASAATDSGTSQNVGAPSAGPGDIIVTARRRDEKLQNVPISVAAFSGATLTRSSVQTIADIRTISPGLTFSSEGGKDNTAVTLRGIGQIPTGEVTPGVVTYFANVPLASLGSNVPTFDIANVQVLKGPQGTLFGRNTLGGAILITPQSASTRDFTGYLEGTYGNYDYKEVQGAVNVPLIKDILAVRVAGQIRRRDPEIYAINGGNGFNNVHQDSGRVSVLFTPTDWLKSTTTADYFKAREYGSGYYLLRQNFSFGALFGPGAIADSLDQQIQGYLGQQKANFYGSFEDSSGSGRANRRNEGISNDTSATFGNFTLRNIFGYRKNKSDQLINTAAVGPTFLPGAAVGSPVDVPFTIFHAAALIERQYLTNETQFLGTFNRFNFIVGAFYSHDTPDGPSGSTFDAFTTPGAPASVVTANVRNTNYAFFGQATYKVTDTLNFTGGIRYSWDKVSACGGAIGTTYASDATCRSIANDGNTTDGVGIVSNRGSAPSWTVGLDWKARPNLLLYVVSRRGYRGVNVNTPLFETPFTTTNSANSVDLRPFQKTGEEKLTDVEIGEKWDFNVAGARGRINTAAYYTKYKNALQFLNVQGIVPSNAPDNPTNASIGVNAADLSIYGVELEASVSPTRNLTLSFNGAYTHVTVDSVSLPPIQGIVFTKDSVNKYAPSFSGTLSGSWTLPFRPLDSNLTLSGDLFMTADFGGQYGEKLPGYNLVNMRLDWEKIGGTGLDLSVFVRNLTKERYFAAADVLLNSFPVNSVAVGDPRTYGVTARYSF